MCLRMIIPIIRNLVNTLRKFCLCFVKFAHSSHLSLITCIMWCNMHTNHNTYNGISLRNLLKFKCINMGASITNILIHMNLNLFNCRIRWHSGVMDLLMSSILINEFYFPSNLYYPHRFVISLWMTLGTSMVRYNYGLNRHVLCVVNKYKKSH